MSDTSSAAAPDRASHETPVPSPPPSKPPRAPRSKPAAQTVGETIVDVVAILAVSALAYAGKVNGDIALVLVGLLAGVRLYDIVGPGGPKGGGGLAGLLLLAGASVGSSVLHLMQRIGGHHG